MSTKRRLVIDFADARPFWRVPEWALDRIREALPEDWECVVIRAAADGQGDGGGRVSAEVLEAAAFAEVYLGFGVPAEVVRSAPRLRWAHSGTAGVGTSLSPEMCESDILLTNSAGIHGPPIAESVLGAMLYFARGFDLALRGQTAGRWDKEPFNAADAPIRELSRSTVGIFGYGGIGREIARRVMPLGAAVIASRRRAEPVAEPGVELVAGDAALATLLARSDYLVLAAPLTEETRGIIDAAALASMKPGAVLINVARGKLVDEAALLDALQTGRLRGAALDVFEREPLRADHPFWSLPNILITPHVAAASHHFWERQTALIVDNIERYLEGRALLNTVDKQVGY